MPAPRSWVETANDPHGDFSVSNLPFGVFSRADGPGRASIGVAIGDQVLDLRRCREVGMLDALPPTVGGACEEDSLNALMALGREAASSVRRHAQHLLTASDARHERPRVEPCLVPMHAVVMRVPATIGDYTDFYASIHHATNVGRLFRPDRPLPPNYHQLPLAYHGRASSIVASGTAVPRPRGQSRGHGEPAPAFGPTQSLDYEVEVGLLIGRGNPLGHAVPLEQAEAAIFGVCLVNDWSARDLQAWESQPLGPFLSKSFVTTISPWVVTLDALEPFRVPAVVRSGETAQPLPYLVGHDNEARGGIDIILEVSLASAEMRAAKLEPVRLGRSQFRDQYWTAAQLVAHHTSNGCNLRSGDLLASGTVSGLGPDAHGCLLELTERGTRPVILPTGEQRTFLEDGDEVIVAGHCTRDGYGRIGFGACRGTVVASPTR